MMICPERGFEQFNVQIYYKCREFGLSRDGVKEEEEEVKAEAEEVEEVVVIHWKGNTQEGSPCSKLPYIGNDGCEDASIHIVN